MRKETAAKKIGHLIKKAKQFEGPYRSPLDCNVEKHYHPDFVCSVRTMFYVCREMVDDPEQYLIRELAKHDIRSCHGYVIDKRILRYILN